MSDLRQILLTLWFLIKYKAYINTRFKIKIKIKVKSSKKKNTLVKIFEWRLIR